MIILKVTKKAGLHALSRRYIFGKTKGVEIDPPAFQGLRIYTHLSKSCKHFATGKLIYFWKQDD